jgi:hypothetical protein
MKQVSGQSRWHTVLTIFMVLPFCKAASSLLRRRPQRKRKLAESRSLLDAALAAGLSGPARLHDLFVSFKAMTPGEFKRMGAGLEFR